MPRDPLGPAPSGLPTALSDAAKRSLRGWLLLAVGALAIAGVLALLLALSRTPVIENWLPWDGQTFFRRALVGHVVFSFVIWVLAMLGAFAVAAKPQSRWADPGLALAAVGMICLLIPTLANSGEPSLNDYVPVLKHPLYLTGLILVAVGVAFPVLQLVLSPPRTDNPFALGVASAGLIYLSALLCFGLAWMGLSRPAEPEPLFWGGGHVLQIVNTMLVLTAWQALGIQIAGRPPLPAKYWRMCCAIMVLGGLCAPPLYSLYSPSDQELRTNFTRLYMIVLPIPMTAGILATAHLLWKSARDWRSPAFIATTLSVAAFAIGGVAGWFVNGADTRTPGHYHAEIGGVNLAFMGMIFALLMPALLARSGGRAERWQFWLYGIGQTLFAVGLFMSGTEGVARKTAGEAQNLDSVVKLIGQGLGGIGGVIAVIGGVTFVWLAIARLWPRRAAQ